MDNRRNARNNGTSRSNTHRSRDRSQNQMHQASASSYHGGSHPTNGGAIRHSIEDRVRRMEESQIEILQLLREARRPPVQREAIYRPQDRPAVEPEHPRRQNEAPPVLGLDADLLDTASSTHPSRVHQPTLNPPMIIEDMIRPRPTDTPRQVLREELQRLIHEEFPLRGGNPLPLHRSYQESSPLAEVILQHPIPTGFKLPNIDLYDGASDPYEHIDHYRTIMHIQRATDALLSQVFPITLKGQARTWFYSLPRGTIHSFDELVKLFVKQFIANRRIAKDSSHLSGIRQNEGETLKEYFQRFSSEARQIPGIGTELLRGVFLGGLRPGPFYSSLMRDTVQSYASLIHRIEAQITADEAINTHRK